jgi:hypothetical protein
LVQSQRLGALGFQLGFCALAFFLKRGRFLLQFFFF